MSGTNTEVWIAANDGQDMIRADAIVVLRLDESGRLTAQLRDEARITVTLLEGSSHDQPPKDFHRQLIQKVAELADSSGARLMYAQHDGGTWRWITERL
ncbi:hypothetical protein [Actinomadura rubrisoli]|uniref:Uncharacterized protein n=1 Tax=Actinomadura rubrisoli TaxID=2530368 RepID=A0A4R5BR54_9ACTN|nr:hypothetical protein [Actinomadura rubrisoli]TDD88016.1 hypothetical protein E1298_15510 [Actinomadura rubrisoli]